MLDLLSSWDTSLLLAINGLHNSFFDSFMYLYSGRFIWVPMYAALLWAMYRSFGWKRAMIIAVGVALVIFLADSSCAKLLRPIFERLRPSNLANPLSEFVHIVNGHRGGAYGFPSCHAANTFALAVLMSLILPRRRFVLALFGWALLTCYSRSYLGVHYPGDLLFGAAVGSVAAVICYWLIRFAAFGGKSTRPSISTDANRGIDLFLYTAAATVAFILVLSIYAVA